MQELVMTSDSEGDSQAGGAPPDTQPVQTQLNWPAGKQQQVLDNSDAEDSEVCK